MAALVTAALTATARGGRRMVGLSFDLFGIAKSKMPPEGGPIP
jgi:hypothetical protein